MLIGLRLDPARSTLLTGFFKQYCTLTMKEEHLLQRKLAQELTPEEVRQIVEITTSWHKKGRLEGRQEVFVIQVQKRFGALPADILEEVNSFSIEQMDTLLDRIFEVSSLDELCQVVSSLN